MELELHHHHLQDVLSVHVHHQVGGVDLDEHAEHREEIPLQQELTLLDGYVKMSGSPLSRRDEIHIDVSPDVLGALVPRMLLPTLAERILRRGEDEPNDACRVGVRAIRHDDGLRVELSVALREPVANREWPDQEIDVDCVREQLQRLYGRTQSIELTTRDTGVLAVMVVPFRAALAGESTATA